MPSKTSLFVLTSLLFLPPAGAATSLHRCEAPDGSITFTSMSCANGEKLSVQK
ncbi:MAG: cell envelope protein SmpA, partial [Pseudomonas sp.]